MKLGISEFDQMMLPLRLQAELTDMLAIADRAPDLMHRLPSVIGLVTIDGQGPAGVIIEDATRGGKYDISSVSTSEDSRQKLAIGFAGRSGLDEMFDKAVLDSGMAFDIDENERFLDFTPSPFRINPHDSPLLSRYRDAAEQSMGAITINIPSNSPLAKAIAQPAGDKLSR